MKMISHQRSNVSKKIIAIIFVASIALGLLFFGSRMSGNILGTVHVPVQATVLLSEGVFETVGAYFIGAKKLMYERDTLTRELASKNGELEALKASIADYDELRALREGNPEHVFAGVLLRPNHTPYDSLVLDKGSKDGIEEGAVVYAPGNRPIGTVMRTASFTSVVALFSSPGIESFVYVRGPNIFVKAIGRGGSVFDVEIPEGVEVAVGDTVLMPTLSPAFLGTIATVRNDPKQPGTIAMVPTETSLNSLRFVAIAKNAFHSPMREEIIEKLAAASTTMSGLFILPPDLITATTSTSTTTTSP